MLTGSGKAIRRAKGLRRDMSLPERLLWRELRGYRGRIKFRRQHPAGPYILDFYCEAAKLAIEIDGESHAMGNNPAHDERRDAWLARQGVRVVRIPAREVLRDLSSVVTFILREAERYSPAP